MGALHICNQKSDSPKQKQSLSVNERGSRIYSQIHLEQKIKKLTRMNNEIKLKVLITGDRGVGKTHFLKNLINDEHFLENDYLNKLGNQPTVLQPTVSMEYFTFQTQIYGHDINLRIQDMPGGVRNLLQVGKYTKDYNIIFLCFSYDDLKSVQNCYNYIEFIRRVKMSESVSRQLSIAESDISDARRFSGNMPYWSLEKNTFNAAGSDGVNNNTTQQQQQQIENTNTNNNNNNDLQQQQNHYLKKESIAGIFDNITLVGIKKKVFANNQKTGNAQCNINSLGTQNIQVKQHYQNQLMESSSLNDNSKCDDLESTQVVSDISQQTNNNTKHNQYQQQQINQQQMFNSKEELYQKIDNIKEKILNTFMGMQYIEYSGEIDNEENAVNKKQSEKKGVIDNNYNYSDIKFNQICNNISKDKCSSKEIINKSSTYMDNLEGLQKVVLPIVKDAISKIDEKPNFQQ